MPTSAETDPSSTFADLPHSDLPIALRKGSRSITVHPISTFVPYDNLPPSFRHLAVSISAESIPNNYSEAFHISLWQSAMLKEMQALVSRGT